MEEIINENFIQIDYFRLLLGSFLLIVQILIISNLYKNFSSSYNNKNKFAKNLIPFGIAILIIVTVIKSSLALSLGLIGALSIIRFRTAIKDPEEIIILLVIMGCAVSIAAEKELVGAILIVIYFICYYFINKNAYSENIDTFDVSVNIRINNSLDLNKLVFNKFNSRLIYFNMSSSENLNLLYKIQNREALKEIINHFNKLKIDYTIETTLNEN
tara:strand:- start:1674 stop:2318 length:645 start_codon:yes stop_codon:yes gene_type:complete